jgi:uncharacterized glyoxalase superfamily protein PhnB
MKTDPRVSPYLFYDDLARAVTFLKKAFAFEERFVDRDSKTKKVTHATLSHGATEVMMGLTSVRDGLVRCRSPKTLRGINAGIYVFVSDVDAHYRKAKKAGAKILMEPEDMHWGDRLYCAADPEGQFWMFASTVRHVPADQR